MDYMDVVRDFARRTLDNLDFFKSAQANDPSLAVFEVTQLVNSLLGLLVFPQQRYVDSIPRTPLAQLAAQGWPIPEVVGDYPQAPDLRQLIRLLRHSIAHFNIRFESDLNGQIQGITLWNVNPQSGKTTWKARMSVKDIEALARSFVGLLLAQGGQRLAVS